MDIQSIVQQAKEMILEHGCHPSLFLIEFQGEEETFMLADNRPEASIGRKQLMVFNAGRQLCLEKPQRHLAQIAYIYEAWGTTVEADMPYKPSWSQAKRFVAVDRQREELLVVAYLNRMAPEPRQEVYSYRMLRDRKGKLIDLLRKNSTPAMHSEKLQIFLAGFDDGLKERAKV